MHLLKNNFYNLLGTFVAICAVVFISYSNGQTTVSMIPKNHPFSYNLGVKIIPSKTQQEEIKEITICCHGYGHNNTIVDCVDAAHVIPRPLVGFNFRDYNITEKTDHHKSKYGTIDEILPLLYLIKYYACNKKIPIINLYGFSAGGGAVINALAVLNKYSYKDQLEHIGISQDDTKQILTALQRGDIILECPLKSMEEIMALRGSSPEFKIMSARYKKNNMNPIDSLNLLSGLTLHVILHFQKPDDILSNRDDNLFIERLQKANKGKTTVSFGTGGGHNTYHPNLWENYKKVKSCNSKKK